MHKLLEEIIGSDFQYRYNQNQEYYSHEFTYKTNKIIRICFGKYMKDPVHCINMGNNLYIYIYPDQELEFQQWLKLLNA